MPLPIAHSEEVRTEVSAFEEKGETSRRVIHMPVELASCQPVMVPNLSCWVSFSGFALPGYQVECFPIASSRWRIRFMFLLRFLRRR